MLILLITLMVPVLVYGVRASMSETGELTRIAKISRSVFVSLAILFSILVAIEKNNYYLIGYRSTSIVYLAATIAGIVYALSDRRFILKSVKRIVLNLFAVVLMMGSVFLVVTMVGDFNRQLIYSNSRFRLESITNMPMSPCGLPVLFVKNGILERRSRMITPDTCVSELNIASVEIKELDSGYLVSYTLVDNTTPGKSFQLTTQYSKP